MKVFFAALLLVSILVYSASAKCKLPDGRKFTEGCQLCKGTSSAVEKDILGQRGFAIFKKRQMASHYLRLPVVRTESVRGLQSLLYSLKYRKIVAYPLLRSAFSCSALTFNVIVCMIFRKIIIITICSVGFFLMPVLDGRFPLRTRFRVDSKSESCRSFNYGSSIPSKGPTVR